MTLQGIEWKKVYKDMPTARNECVNSYNADKTDFKTYVCKFCN